MWFGLKKDDVSGVSLVWEDGKLLNFTMTAMEMHITTSQTEKCVMVNPSSLLLSTTSLGEDSCSASHLALCRVPARE